METPTRVFGLTPSEIVSAALEGGASRRRTFHSFGDRPFFHLVRGLMKPNAATAGLAHKFPVIVGVELFQKKTAKRLRAMGVAASFTRRRTLNEYDYGQNIVTLARS